MGNDKIIKFEVGDKDTYSNKAETWTVPEDGEYVITGDGKSFSIKAKKNDRIVAKSFKELAELLYNSRK